MKKLFALLLAGVCVAGIFTGCVSGGKDDSDSEDSTDTGYVTVTDKNGETVTDENGEPVTEKSSKSAATGDNGDSTSTRDNGTADTDTTKIPYSTTAPGSTISNSTWPFGAWDVVGIVLPEGWERVTDTYNYVRKIGTNFEVIANPKNLYKDECSTVAEYAQTQRNALKEQCSKYEELLYEKEVYEDGAAAQLVAKIKDEKGTRYCCFYIFQDGDDIMTFNCFSKKKSEIYTSIEEVIANTCYRG